MTLAKVCPTCGAIACTEHKRTAWQDRPTNRPKRSGWSQQRRARGILALHSRVCHICGLAGATEVDHVIPLSQGGADEPDNLRPIHTDCHRQKTAEEARQARGR